jgi:ubiquinone/menaquinone biosynthesis C-methylase UbiE
MATATAPNPALFFDTINSYQRTAALKAAIELEVFTGIGEGKTSAQALAERAKASPRGLRILCDYLVVNGLLTKKANDYGLTPDSALFLDKRSPAYLGTTVGFLTAPELMAAYDDLTAVVRKGGTIISTEGTVAPDNPIWVEFARSMAPMMAAPAQWIAGLVGAAGGQKCKVLDIAAGHGVFGITLAKLNPNAEIVALDWKAVLAVAKENAERAGVISRYRTIEGSAFDADFGTGYDVVLLTNFLHHFDAPTCEKLLRKVRAALAPGGRAVTLEFVPNDDRVSPPTAAAFSMMMLAGTAGGDAYTFAELEKMFRNAGFSRSELHENPSSPQRIVVSNK